jgi:hypothetical protein
MLSITFKYGPFDGFTLNTLLPEDSLSELVYFPICSQVLDAMNGEFSDDVAYFERVAIYEHDGEGRYRFFKSRDVIPGEHDKLIAWACDVIDACAEIHQKEQK